MTHTDFNHLLSSIKGLSPEQVRRLRQQLDRQLAQPRSAGRSAARQDGQARQARCAEEEAPDARRVQSAPAEDRPHLLAARSRPGHRRRRSRRSAGHHQGRAAVGNHHPRAALTVADAPTSSIPAPWSSATSRRPARPGCAASRARRAHPPSFTSHASPPSRSRRPSPAAARAVRSPPHKASSILYRFRQHLAGRYTVIEITPALVDAAMRLANTHCATRLRRRAASRRPRNPPEGARMPASPR